MKTHPFIISALSVFLLLITTACPPQDRPEIVAVDISNKEETSVVLHWGVTTDEFSSIRIILSNETDLSESVRTISIEGNTSRSILLDGLTGLTKYSFRLELLDSNAELITSSEEKTFITSYTSEKLEISTMDGYLLRGNIYYLGSWSTKSPGIIMMHGLGEVMAPWPKSETMDILIQQGYVCMTFNFRGHGNSQSFDTKLFKSSKGAFYLGCDVKAAVQYMIHHSRVDSSSIGLMGGSMGGTASVLGNYFPEVRTSVALGPVINDGPTIMSYFPELEGNNLKSIYYIVGELDNLGDYDFPGISATFYKVTEEPRNLWIIPGISHHGSALTTHLGVNDSIAHWFTKTIPSPNAR